MRTSKRILAMLLAVFLLVSITPVTMTQAAAVDEAANAVVRAADPIAPLTAGPEIGLGLNGYDNGHFAFNADGSFRILQLSDVQTEEGFTRSDGTTIANSISRFTINAIQNAIKVYKPDLIVMTGDQINANRGNNSMTAANLQVVAEHYANIVLAVDPNVKFAFTMGNHDAYSNFSIDGATGAAATQKQYDAFKAAFGSNFVDYDVADLDGTGNGMIDIYAEDSLAARVFLFDTRQSCIGGSDGEDAGSTNRAIVNWYSQNATVPNVVFQHIVPNEIVLCGDNGDWITEGQTNGLMTGVANSSVGGWGSSSPLTLSESAIGEMNEVPDPYATNINRLATKQQFIAMADHQCKGVFFGHDHVNSYSGTVTVYGRSLDFYSCPGLTAEEYYNPPAVRTVTLNRSGSSVTVSSEVKNMEQLEKWSAETRVQNNEIGVYEGGVPALETVAAPAVLYKGSADNNADPINNQSFGNILQKYIYNYETLHLDTANTAVRFTLPAAATVISVMATKSTATDGTVNLSGNTISISTPTSVTLADGSKLYTAKLPEGADLTGVSNVVYKVTYAFKGNANTICATSCVEDIKIPAGYAVAEGPYYGDANATSKWESMMQQKYLFTISGENVYGTAANAGSDYWGVETYDTQYMGYSNGWQALFSSLDSGLDKNNSSISSFKTGGSESRYALAYHGYDQSDGSDRYKHLDGNHILQYSMNLNDGNHGDTVVTRAPEAIVYIDKSNAPFVNNRYDYGAVLTFSNLFMTNDFDTTGGAHYRNLRDYPTYVTGIGFSNIIDTETTASGHYALGKCNKNGFWTNHARFDGTNGVENGTTGTAAIEAELAGSTADITYNGVFAHAQSIYHVTTTHVNSNTSTANLIPNDGILSYRFTSDNASNYADNGERLSMIVGTRTQRQAYGTTVVLYVLQSVSLTFHTYNKGALRLLVQSEMRERRDGSNGSVAAFTAWRQALVEAQAVLANSRVDQAMIDSKLAALTAAADGFSCSPETGHTYDSGVYLKEPTCTEDGIISYTCSVCGHIYTERVPAAHDYVATIITAPTCTKEGLARYDCSRCDSTYEDVVPAKGHTYSEWVTVINPTTTSTGKMCRHCTDCGIVLDEMTMPILIDDQVTGITLSSAKAYMNRNETLTLTATVMPASAMNKTVLWTSSEPDVATVENGVVTAVGPGITVITAQTADCGYKAFCLIQVNVVTPKNGAQIDGGVISGLSVNLNGLDDYLTVNDATMTLAYATDVIGTGTKVFVMQGDEVVNEFTTLLFGDVNGDGWYDGTDAYFVQLVASGMVSQSALTAMQRTAADCNHDNAIDAADAAVLERAGLLLSSVDQTAPREELETNSVFLEYCGLIDQSMEPIESDQPTEDVEAQPVKQSVWGWFKALFTIVLNWLLRVF